MELGELHVLEDLSPAAWMGRQAHPLMQWHALIGAAPSSFDMSESAWPGEAPDWGNLPASQLAALCDLLTDHTAASDCCCFGLWEGYGGLKEHGWTSHAARRESSPDPAGHVFSAEELRRPRLRLPSRDYLVLAGALRDALRICSWLADWPGAQSPNLFWPADRAWCVASEIDFDSTLVGAPAGLVQAILQAPELDAWPVGPDDSLAHGADRINVLRS